MPTTEKLQQYFKKNDTFANTLGIELLEISDGYGVATMPICEKTCNGMGFAHGGAIFALVDMAFAAASHSDGLYWVNAQSSISYVAPGKKSPLRGEARAIRKGRHLGVYEIRVTDAEGTLVATATVNGFNTGKQLREVAE